MLRAFEPRLLGRVAQRVQALASSRLLSTMGSDGVEYMDFPGGRVPFTGGLSWQGPGFTHAPVIPCFRALDGRGNVVEGCELKHEIGKDKALRMYETMILLQAVDTIFYEAQRQVLDVGLCWPSMRGCWVSKIRNMRPLMCSIHMTYHSSTL